MDIHRLGDYEAKGRCAELYIEYAVGGLFTERGYYLCAFPFVRVSGRSGESRAYYFALGSSYLLLGAKRKSAKGLSEAIAMATSDVINQLIERCKFEEVGN